MALLAVVVILLGVVGQVSDCGVAQAASKAGALVNTSFEEGTGAGPAGWRKVMYGGDGEYEYVEGGRTGKKCVMLSSDSGADIAWFVTAAVKPRSRYRLSGWIKTENVKSTGQRSARGALLNLHNIQPAQTKAVTGTKDWTKVEIVFDTGARTVAEINCLFGGWGWSTGKAWYDDLQLELLSTASGKKSVEIDASKTKEPVSKYIYGQFIEHLGRCIYGGIWAEMLEDRKFWYPVTANYDPYKGTRAVAKDGPFPVVGASPWQIIGDVDSVTMVKENSFVGEYTPLIAVGGGIAQHDLALRKGKEYVGYVWLKPAAGKTTVRVSLRWGDKGVQSEGIACTGDRYVKSPLHFRAVSDTERATLQIEVIGRGACFIGTVSLMPSDNINGMRADTIALLKELDAPIYRWPGGNFVSGYDWRDGIGPRDRRPPRTNPAWTGVEHNDFGIDELMVFCKEVGAEPLITVNSGFGDDHSAAEEVEYVVGAPDTPMGKWRAANGHREPYEAKWWCIGNEMYGGWQLGSMKLNHYIIKHNLFAKAMRRVYPEIKLIAVGAVGEWSEGMLKGCADYMDAISEHFYKREKPSVLEHANQTVDAVRSKVTAHQDYRERLESLKGKDIDIALDEWNYWYGPHVFGELGTRYFLKDGLGIAAGLHEMIRYSDWYFMANYAQTVNVIGCIKTSKAEAAFATTGLALQLYRARFGVIPVEVGGDAYPLDVVAAWTANRKALTVAVVNPTEEKQDVPMSIKGARLSGKGKVWVISHSDPMAYNEPGKEPKVAIKEKAVSGISNKLSAPALSISIYELAVRYE